MKKIIHIFIILFLINISNIKHSFSNDTINIAKGRDGVMGTTGEDGKNGPTSTPLTPGGGDGKDGGRGSDATIDENITEDITVGINTVYGQHYKGGQGGNGGIGGDGAFFAGAIDAERKAGNGGNGGNGGRGGDGKNVDINSNITITNKNAEVLFITMDGGTGGKGGSGWYGGRGADGYNQAYKDKIKESGDGGNGGNGGIGGDGGTATSIYNSTINIYNNNTKIKTGIGGTGGAGGIGGKGGGGGLGETADKSGALGRSGLGGIGGNGGNGGNIGVANGENIINAFMSANTDFKIKIETGNGGEGGDDEDRDIDGNIVGVNGRDGQVKSKGNGGNGGNIENNTINMLYNDDLNNKAGNVLLEMVTGNGGLGLINGDGGNIYGNNITIGNAKKVDLLLTAGEGKINGNISNNTINIKNNKYEITKDENLNSGIYVEFNLKSNKNTNNTVNIFETENSLLNGNYTSDIYSILLLYKDKNANQNSSISGEIHSNILNVNDENGLIIINGNVYGAYTNTNAVIGKVGTKNTLNINLINSASLIGKDIYGVKSTNGSVIESEVNIKSLKNYSKNLYGAYIEGKEANSISNKVNIINNSNLLGSISIDKGNIYGAYIKSNNIITKNEINIALKNNNENFINAESLSVVKIENDSIKTNGTNIVITDNILNINSGNIDANNGISVVEMVNSDSVTSTDNIIYNISNNKLIIDANIMDDILQNNIIINSNINTIKVDNSLIKNKKNTQNFSNNSIKISDSHNNYIISTKDMHLIRTDEQKNSNSILNVKDNLVDISMNNNNSLISGDIYLMKLSSDIENIKNNTINIDGGSISGNIYNAYLTSNNIRYVENSKLDIKNFNKISGDIVSNVYVKSNNTTQNTINILNTNTNISGNSSSSSSIVTSNIYNVYLETLDLNNKINTNVNVDDSKIDLNGGIFTKENVKIEGDITNVKVNNSNNQGKINIRNSIMNLTSESGNLIFGLNNGKIHNVSSNEGSVNIINSNLNIIDNDLNYIQIINKIFGTSLIHHEQTESGIHSDNRISVNILNKNSFIDSDLYGSYIDSYTNISVKNNVIDIENATKINGNIYSSYILESSIASNNVVNVNNGNINGEIYGLYYQYKYDNVANTQAQNHYLNGVNINGGSIVGNIYGAYIEKLATKQLQLESNFVSISGGKIIGNIYGAYVKKGNDTIVSGNKIDIKNVKDSVYIKGNIVSSEINDQTNTSNIENSLVSFKDNNNSIIKIDGDIYGSITNGSGNLNSSIIDINNSNILSNLKSSIYSAYNSSALQGNSISRNNKINVTNSTLDKDLYALYTKQKSDSNSINIEENSTINADLFASYIDTSNNTDATISSVNSKIIINKNNVINGNLYANYINLNADFIANNTTITPELNNSIISIVNGNTINGNIYSLYINNATSEDINKSTINIVKDNIINNSIYVQKNNKINGNIYTGIYVDENKIENAIGINNSIIIESDLRYMENNKNKIFVGDTSKSNSIIFTGENTYLLTEKIIQGSPKIKIIGTNNNEIDNNIITNKPTNVIISKNGNYTSDFDIDGNITLDLNLKNLENNKLISTTGEINKLNNGSKINLSLNSLTDYGQYILFESNVNNLTSNDFILENEYIKGIREVNSNGVKGILIDTYRSYDGIMRTSKNLSTLNHLIPFTKAINDSHEYIYNKENRDKYKDTEQFKLLHNLVFIFNDLDIAGQIENHKDPIFIENLLKSWLPDLSGVIYRSASNNFNSISNKIYSRFTNLKNQNSVKSNKASYNYLLNKTQKELPKIFDYDYSPLKSRKKRVVNWVEIYENNTKQKTDKNIDSYDSVSQHFILGKETIYDKKMIFGIMLNGNKRTANTNFKDIDIMSIGGGAYLKYNINEVLFLGSILSYNFSNYKEESTTKLDYEYKEANTIKASVKDLKFNSKYNSNQVSANLALGMDMKYIIPKIELNSTFLKVNNYKDNYDQDIFSKNYSTVVGSGSLIFKDFMNFKIGNLRVNPEFFGKLNIGLVNTDMEVSGKLNGESNYTVNAGKIDNNSVEFGAKIGFDINSINIGVSYNTLNGKVINYSELGLNFSFIW